MSEMAKVLGLPEEIEFEGATYKVSPMTLALEAEWEKWLEARAWAALKKNALNTANYAEQEERLIRSIAAGKYAWGSEVSIDAQFTRAGRVQMLLIRMKPYHPQITPDTVAKIVERQEEEVLRVMRSLDDDPLGSTPPRPAQGADGSSAPQENSSPASSGTPTASTTSSGPAA